MILNQFLQSSGFCPLCGKETQLLLSVDQSSLWKGKKYGEQNYRFTFDSSPWEKVDHFTVIDAKEEVAVIANTLKLSQASQGWQMFLAELCGSSQAITQQKDSYSLDANATCYYRNSPFVEIRDGKLQVINPDHQQMLCRDEYLAFRVLREGLYKKYIVSFSPEDQKAVLYHYSFTPEQEQDPNFAPKIHQLDLLALPERPNLSWQKREELISQIESWIIFS